MEAWVWTELLAFDNTSPDFGVGAYLETAQERPYGISLLLSSIDFVLLHAGITEEYELFRDIASRFGHPGNENRERQRWTNCQLRGLVAALQRAGIKVYASVFAIYLEDRFHTEWVSACPECRVVFQSLGLTNGVELLSRRRDGVLVEDLFTAKLREVVLDYGFDGFHGADGMGPGCSIAESNFSDDMTHQFCATLADPPRELRQSIGADIPQLQRRAALIRTHFRTEWRAFHCRRWAECWEKITTMLHAIGKGSMINSANTKGAVEGMYQFGIDFRIIPADYLVVESVAANLSLIHGGYDRHFDFAATLMDLAALTAPDKKILFLHGVKDVVESYDLLRHAPGRLEREFFTLANLFCREAKERLRRCADGFMMCLGDGESADEWRYLWRQWQAGFEFDAVRAGDFTWIWPDQAVDAQVLAYPRCGNWPGALTVGALTARYALCVACVCRLSQLSHAKGPLLVTDAETLTQGQWEALRRYSDGPVTAIGSFAAGEFPEGGYIAIQVPIADGRSLAVITLHAEAAEPPALLAEIPAFADTGYPAGFWLPTPYLAIPEEFWQKTADIMAGLLPPGIRADQLAGKLRLLTMSDGAGTRRVGLVSIADHYLVPEWHCRPKPERIAKVSAFPYTPVLWRDGHAGTGWANTPLHIPPCGIIVLDLFAGTPSGD